MFKLICNYGTTHYRVNLMNVVFTKSKIFHTMNRLFYCVTLAVSVLCCNGLVTSNLNAKTVIKTTDVCPKGIDPKLKSGNNSTLYMVGVEMARSSNTLTRKGANIDERKVLSTSADDSADSSSSIFMSSNSGLNINQEQALDADRFGIYGGIGYIASNNLFTSIEAGLNFGGFSNQPYGKFADGSAFKRKTSKDGTDYAAAVSSNFGARVDIMLGHAFAGNILPFVFVGGRYDRLSVTDATDYTADAKSSGINSLGYAFGLGVKVYRGNIGIFGKYAVSLGGKFSQEYEGKVASSSAATEEKLSIGEQTNTKVTHSFVMGLDVCL